MQDRDVYIGAVAVGAVYSAILHRLHRWYSPNYIWLTVVGGNILIAGVLWILAKRGRFEEAALRHFVSANIALGTPVIIWQLLQHYRRRQVLHRHHEARRWRS
jgi:hypothetical protein